MKTSAYILLLFALAACAPTSHQLRQSIAERPKTQPTEKFSHPLKGAKILSHFGRRDGTYHMGIDLQKNRKGGEAIKASRSGKVLYAKVMRGYGRIVSILHKDRYVSRYAHLKSFLIKTGDHVQAGQAIGTVGQSGRASTPHLHFEILTPEGKFIDPMYFLEH